MTGVGRGRGPVEQFERGDRVEAPGCYTISAQTPINPPSSTDLERLIGPSVAAAKTSDDVPFQASR